MTKQDKKIVVVVSKELSHQISWLHKSCPRGTEWSGLLVYEVTGGNVHDDEVMSIKAHGVFPMDFGDSTFTSFEGNEDWFKMFQQYPQVDPMNPKQGWYIGKIHSHHSMSVFHSGVDTGDVNATTPKLNMFLSLIVNYAWELDCKLGVAVEKQETIVTRVKQRFKGLTQFTNKFETRKQASTSVLTLDCKCYWEHYNDQWFIDQVTALGKKPKKSIGYDYGTDYSHSYRKPYEYTPNNQNVLNFPKATWKVKTEAEKCISSLVTLGMGPFLPMDAAVKAVDIVVNMSNKEQYKKALKLFFVEYWFLKNFYTLENSTPVDALSAVKELLEDHDRTRGLWMTTTIKEALHELKVSQGKLWQI